MTLAEQSFGTTALIAFVAIATLWTLASHYRWVRREEYAYRFRQRTWNDYDDDNRWDAYKTR